MAQRVSLTDFAGATAGVVLTALGLDLFLVPFKIAAGGLSGVAVILHYLLQAPVGITMLVLNIPLFVMAFYRLGSGFVARSLYGTITLSVAVDILAPLVHPLSHNILLASVFGGVVEGLGLGLVFKYRGTTGGTDLVAAILRSYYGVNMGQLLFVVDGAVALAAGLVFASADLTMFALITIFITSWVIDLVLEGFGYAKAFLIISQKAGEIGKAVMSDLGRGVTAWTAHGLYTGNKREVLMVVVSRAEVTRLKDMVYQLDPQAFVILANVHEVLGEGFKDPARS